MNTIRTMQAMGVSLSLLLTAFISGANAQEEMKPEFKSAVYFGGSGNQGAAQDGMGIAASATRLYLSGADLSLYGGQALAACYAIPPGSSPVWSFRWPNVQGNGWWNDESFPAIAVTEEGVYCAGRSSGRFPDGAAWGKENNAVLVKFPLTGATGPGVGGAVWIARPLFFPYYRGIETFIGGTASREGGSTTLYAVGRGQSNGSNNTAVAAKFDSAGKVLWTRVLGKTESAAWSQGDSVKVHNGSLYVAGYTHWQGYQSYLGSKNPIRPHAGLWKLDPNGNILWARESAQPIYQNSLAPITVAALGKFLYVACTREIGANGVFTYDLLVLKYDEAGNLLWSKEWGSTGDEVPTGLAATDNRLYVVGYTTGWVGGGKDLFLVEMDPDSGNVLSAVYHGGKYDDVAYGVQVAGRDLYIVGDSKSATEGGNAQGQSDLMLLRYTLSAPVPVLNASIDIRPESFPNPVNPKSQGNIPVAILSTPAFDAPALVDRSTLTFGRTGLEKSLKRCVKEDVNGDGRPDLLCHFDTQLCAFQMGDTRGVLMGKTLAGRPFVGSDSVVIVPHMKKGDEPKEIKPPARSPGQIPGEKVKAPVPGGGIHGPDKKDSSVVY